MYQIMLTYYKSCESDQHETIQQKAKNPLVHSQSVRLSVLQGYFVLLSSKISISLRHLNVRTARRSHLFLFWDPSRNRDALIREQAGEYGRKQMRVRWRKWAKSHGERSSGTSSSGWLVGGTLKRSGSLSTKGCRSINACQHFQSC